MKKILVGAAFLFIPALAFADATSTAMITIRDGNLVGFAGAVQLAASTSPPVDIAPTSSTSTIAVPADSLLATLVALDATSGDFDISDLQYFSSFNSFFINCITIPAATDTPLCGNWQFSVDGIAPQVGADHVSLQDGDGVFLYFGFPRQVALSTTTIAAGEAFTATADVYNPADNLFATTTGVTIGVTQSNPADPFTPIEIATSTADQNGQAIFTLDATGTYDVGIKEDFYFPTTQITVIDAGAASDSGGIEPPPPPTGGGGGGVTHAQLNVPAALAYLAKRQHADGSFDSSLMTDWAALAFAAADPGPAKQLLKAFESTASPAFSSATDFERHAMALEALDINPHSGTPTNYIAKITAAFDGVQIGSSSLDNDDIFALFPLLHAGYSTGDDVIQKIVAFIVSRQESNGSWDGSGDVTSAAIQALSQASVLPRVGAAITKAESYLHTTQQSDGGFGSSFSTSWALQAIAALNEPPSSWAPGGPNPDDYLASLQQQDGGVEPISNDTQTRIWATEYAVPASLGRTWDSLLHSFSMPTSQAGTSGGAVLGAATSTLPTATSTETVATSTPLAATTTPVISSEISSSSPVLAAMPGPVIHPQPKPREISVSKETSIPKAAPLIRLAGAAAPVASSGDQNIWNRIIGFFAWLLHVIE